MEKIHFDAVPLSVEQVEEKFMNELANGNGGIMRRVATAFLSNSSEHYYKQEMTEELGEAMLSQTDSLTAYINLIKAHLEMMEAARARLFAVLSYHFR